MPLWKRRDMCLLGKRRRCVLPLRQTHECGMWHICHQCLLLMAGICYPASTNPDKIHQSLLHLTEMFHSCRHHSFWTTTSACRSLSHLCFHACLLDKYFIFATLLIVRGYIFDLPLQIYPIHSLWQGQIRTMQLNHIGESFVNSVKNKCYCPFTVASSHREKISVKIHFSWV